MKSVKHNISWPVCDSLRDLVSCSVYWLVFISVNDLVGSSVYWPVKDILIKESV